MEPRALRTVRPQLGSDRLTPFPSRLSNPQNYPKTTPKLPWKGVETIPPRRRSDDAQPVTRRRKATTPEGRERQLIGDAYDLAERQIREGTASAQVLSIFLKAGSSRERLEQKRLDQENRLIEGKIESMVSAKKVEEMYGRALNAMRRYSGQEPEDMDDRDD